MGEKFAVPEPSKEAVQAYAMSTPSTINAGLRAAYAVDVPALCQREMEKLLWAIGPVVDATTRNAIITYCKARYGRFPEAAPHQGRQLDTGEPPVPPALKGKPTGHLAAPPSEAPAKACARHNLFDCPVCVAAARPEGEQCDEEGPQGHPPHPQWASPLCTKPKGHAGPHQRYEGKPWPNTSCTACACERCQAKEAFVRVLAQAYFDAEANRVVLKHSDLFLAAKALLAKEGA